MSESWKLTTTRQCAKCPWRVDTDPREIPNGYTEDKHRALESTIERRGVGEQLASDSVRVMTCHESNAGDESMCLGWLMNQLGPGNNISMRLMARRCENINDVELIGEQHQTFEDTLP